MFREFRPVIVTDVNDTWITLIVTDVNDTTTWHYWSRHGPPYFDMNLPMALKYFISIWNERSTMNILGIFSYKY